jgi:hypothetical protein
MEKNEHVEYAGAALQRLLNEHGELLATIEDTKRALLRSCEEYGLRQESGARLSDAVKSALAASEQRRQFSEERGILAYRDFLTRLRLLMPQENSPGLARVRAAVDEAFADTCSDFFSPLDAKLAAADALADVVRTYLRLGAPTQLTHALERFDSATNGFPKMPRCVACNRLKTDPEAAHCADPFHRGSSAKLRSQIGNYLRNLGDQILEGKAEL